MEKLWNLNLIHFLDFYFTFMFIAGTWRRIRQYSEFGKLVVSGPRRWPLLLGLMTEHRTIFLTWTTVAPAALALLLTAAQLLASRVFLPDAGDPAHALTLGKLAEHYLELPIVLLLAVGVLAVDLYFLIAVGQIDRLMLEKYFDQAEYWLASPTARVVHVVTLGFVNPRQMVSAEVRKALVMAGDLLNSTLWWVVLQLGLRFCFGLSLWIAWWLG